ncbi:hypothetical protein DFH07DRAFT_941571 [Mycena maculata]|uniref:FAD-binding domain-containing protein n=1 Tax=Mycena maculata TaxID=230809 RepID=A0AAD7IXP1_9AGAR|nr:hypothetical protein DFH07DRAFT_941571 [Mycena maculata]
MSSQRSIAIVGAGLGGLVCARVLQLQNIPVIIYEREPTPTSRQQGGSLDMHSDSGFKALQMAQLVDEFKKIARYEDQNMKIGWMARFTLRTSKCRPRSRSKIGPRRIEHCYARSYWTRCNPAQSVTQDDRNKPTLHFLDTALEPVTHDFVIGADGSWSRVRPTLSPTVPMYSGVTFVDLFLADITAKTHPELAAFVQPGMAMVLGDNKAVIAQRNSNDVVRVYAALRKPLAWLDEVGLTEGKEGAAQEVLLREFAGWCPQATGWLRVPCESIAVRPLYTFKRHAWAANPGVTILGDAAHSMVPFAGEGANLAMLDGAELATLVAKNISATPGVWLKAIKGFEAQMQRRAVTMSDESMKHMGTMIAEGDAAARAGTMMRRMMMVANAWKFVRKSLFGWIG